MIFLDTNIISELMKSVPCEKVTAWIDQQVATQLFITTITIAEISYGLHVLSKGRRRSLLEAAFNNAIIETFKQRIISFDESAAHFYGELMGQRKELGRPMSIADGQIAAIARAKKATIATRNVRDFVDCGLNIINPFSPSTPGH